MGCPAFDQHLVLGSSSDEEDQEHVLRLAIGAPPLEMTRMDGEIWPEQREAVEDAVRGRFDLTEDDAAKHRAGGR